MIIAIPDVISKEEVKKILSKDSDFSCGTATLSWLEVGEETKISIEFDEAPANSMNRFFNLTKFDSNTGRSGSPVGTIQLTRQSKTVFEITKLLPHYQTRQGRKLLGVLSIRLCRLWRNLAGGIKRVF